MDDSAIEYQPVSSSTLAAVGYDPAVGRLWVKFRGGATYAYERVEPAVHAALLSAPSKGKFLFNVIRAGGTDSVYAYARVR